MIVVSISDIICDILAEKLCQLYFIFSLERKVALIMGKFEGIFDDVVVNAKAAANAVSQKASAVCDVSKHKLTAAEIRGEINKKLRELGALTYKSQTKGADVAEQISVLVSEITEFKDNLSIINEHIASSKNQKRCPQCDASVPKNSLFCNICGARLDEDTNDTAEL